MHLFYKGAGLELEKKGNASDSDIVISTLEKHDLKGKQIVLKNQHENLVFECREKISIADIIQSLN